MRNAWRLGAGHADLRRPEVSSHAIEIDAAPQTLVLDIARAALLVVDLQNDFCHQDGWLAGIGVDISPARTPIEPLRTFLPVARDAGIPVIWVNWGNRPDRANLPPGVLHVYDPDGAGVGIGSTSSRSGAPILQKGSWAAEVVDELVVAPSDILVDKYRMSGFVDSPLDSILRNLRVDSLLFAGVNADQCVLATLTDAANLGYDVIMLTDVVGTTSPQFCMDATLYNVRQCFGFTATSASVSAALVARHL